MQFGDFECDFVQEFSCRAELVRQQEIDYASCIQNILLYNETVSVRPSVLNTSKSLETQQKFFRLFRTSPRGIIHVKFEFQQDQITFISKVLTIVNSLDVCRTPGFCSLRDVTLLCTRWLQGGGALLYYGGLTTSDPSRPRRSLLGQVFEVKQATERAHKLTTGKDMNISRVHFRTRQTSNTYTLRLSLQLDRSFRHALDDTEPMADLQGKNIPLGSTGEVNYFRNQKLRREFSFGDAPTGKIRRFSDLQARLGSVMYKYGDINSPLVVCCHSGRRRLDQSSLGGVKQRVVQWQQFYQHSSFEFQLVRKRIREFFSSFLIKMKTDIRLLRVHVFKNFPKTIVEFACFRTDVTIEGDCVGLESVKDVWLTSRIYLTLYNTDFKMKKSDARPSQKNPLPASLSDILEDSEPGVLVISSASRRGQRMLNNTEEKHVSHTTISSRTRKQNIGTPFVNQRSINLAYQQAAQLIGNLTQLDFTDCSVKVDFTDCPVKVDFTDCSVKVDFTDCSVKVDFTDCSVKVDFTDCSVKTRPACLWANSRLAMKHLANPMTARCGATANGHSTQRTEASSTQMMKVATLELVNEFGTERVRSVAGVLSLPRLWVKIHTVLPVVLRDVTASRQFLKGRPANPHVMPHRTPNPQSRGLLSLSGSTGDLLPLKAVCTFASHQGEPGSKPGRVTSFLQVGIMPYDAVGRRAFSRGSPVFPVPSFRCRFIIHFNHPHRLSRPRLRQESMKRYGRRRRAYVKWYHVNALDKEQARSNSSIPTLQVRNKVNIASEIRKRKGCGSDSRQLHEAKVFGQQLVRYLSNERTIGVMQAAALGREVCT
ncbi:hypothetical protein PR048_026370 [Dryococelus australis]|uniref:Uncharacterized protein n=1 Tax=Dryococelus australis TaxID=614101 RepID=A0ABQ9GL79_9NEOP|nr:hypothetical protein PR048_026370 [Dryococelus australis]